MNPQWKSLKTLECQVEPCCRGAGVKGVLQACTVQPTVVRLEYKYF